MVSAPIWVPAWDVRTRRADGCRGGPLNATTYATTTPKQQAAATNTDGRTGWVRVTGRVSNGSRGTTPTERAATRTTCCPPNSDASLLIAQIPEERTHGAAGVRNENTLVGRADSENFTDMGFGSVRLETPSAQGNPVVGR